MIQLKMRLGIKLSASRKGRGVLTLELVLRCQEKMFFDSVSRNHLKSNVKGWKASGGEDENFWRRLLSERKM